MDEWWDVVDAGGGATGTTFRRGDSGWPAGSFHLVVTVCVHRADGTVLVTQRAPTKEFAYGWEFPGGSALAGESGTAAACRELREETALEVAPEALQWVGRFTEDSALVDLFTVGEPAGSTVRPAPAEVMAWKWLPASGVVELRQSGVMADPWGPRLDALWPAAMAAIRSAGEPPAVQLEAHRDSWETDYQREASRLVAALGDRVLAIEHIGSTAIPGLEAKPVIDIAVRVAVDTDPSALGPLLAATGYTQHRSGPKNHGVYTRERDGARTHILHAFASDQWDECNQRLFRDKLLSDPTAVARYREVKTRAARSSDGRAYTAAKSQVVQQLLDEERAARGLASVTAWDKEALGSHRCPSTEGL